MKIRPNIVRLPINQIEVGQRLRPIRAGQIENLMMLAEDTGITTPIHVRKVRTRYILIDGARRLEAAKRMGMTEIAALIVECRADEAKNMEAANNLGTPKMTPLETVICVTSWRNNYYELHPERKPGVFKGNQYTGKVVGDNLSLTKIIADSFACDEKTIQRALRVGKSLTKQEIAMLMEASVRISMEDLKYLAKIADKKERAAVVAKLGSGEVKRAKDALKAIRPKAEAEPPPSAADQQWRTMCDAFTRASKPARRRFVQDNANALRDLLAEIS